MPKKRTIDEECCKHIDSYISTQESVTKKLEEIRSTWKRTDTRSFHQVLKDNGLAVDAIAGGGMSQSAKKKAKCYREVTQEIEKNNVVAIGQLIQQLVIGGHGYWNPLNWVRSKGYAHSQWILARLAIEIGRSKWRTAKLKQIQEQCKVKYPSLTKEGTKKQCNCYCLEKWRSPIAAPYIPRLPNKISGNFFTGTQIETETGEEFWTASVKKKTYSCSTKKVIKSVSLSLNLVHNSYSRSRSRVLIWRLAWPPVTWGPWTGWSPFANTGNLNDRDALGTSSPASMPWCPDEKIKCP